MAVFLATSFTLIAFAANSILCRLALGGEVIDPVSCTTLRLISGAVILFPVSRMVKEPGAAGEKKWKWGTGLGYVLWYRALRRITTTQAAIVQLLVPVLAAFGGIIFLSETLSLRLLVASSLILGGVAGAVLKRSAGTKDLHAEPAMHEGA